MLLRNFMTNPRPETHIAVARLATRIGPDLAEAAFVTPLQRQLDDAGLGSVAGFEICKDRHGEPEALTLNLVLVTDATRALERVEEMLQELDAPEGSTLQIAGSDEVRSFGQSQGLGIYLPLADADKEHCLDIVEICTDAMEGAGLYQGSAQVGNRTALYFYGDSFNRMRKAITFAMTHDPRCKNAETRRLT